MVFVHVPSCDQHLIIVCSLRAHAVCLRTLIQTCSKVRRAFVCLSFCSVFGVYLPLPMGRMCVCVCVCVCALTESRPVSKSRNCRVCKAAMALYHGTVAKCPARDIKLHSRCLQSCFPSHSIFHVNYKILPNVRLLQNK